MSKKRKGYIKIKLATAFRPSATKGNSKFKIQLVKKFVPKQKANQILSAAIEKKIVSSRKQLHISSGDSQEKTSLNKISALTKSMNIANR